MPKYVFECFICGTTDKKKFNTYSRKFCKKCTVEVGEERMSIYYREYKNRNWRKEYDNSINFAYNYIKSSAKQRKIYFNIARKYFFDLWIKQDKKCYYCGEKLVRARLDRVNSKKGYIKDNIVFSCKNCNLAKNVLSEEEYLNLCKMVVEYRKL